MSCSGPPRAGAAFPMTGSRGCARPEKAKNSWVTGAGCGGKRAEGAPVGAPSGSLARAGLGVPACCSVAGGADDGLVENLLHLPEGARRPQVVGIIEEEPLVAACKTDAAEKPHRLHVMPVVGG